MNYRDEVKRTLPAHMEKDFFTIGALGLAGECGEVVDIIKKHLFHGATIDRDKLRKELGDVRWYFEAICIAAGLTIDEIEQANALKLRARYPNGFNTSDAQARRDEK